MTLNNLMSEEHTRKIQQHYLPLLKQHGPTFRAVDWGSCEGQASRFRVLLEIEDDLFNASVLDLGCGVGHLVEHLAAQNFQGRYLGIDTLPEMIACARELYPTWSFQEGNILKLEKEWTADYVLGSGLFTFANSELMENTLQTMFGICKKAVAFNSLSIWAEHKEPGEFYVDPLAMVRFCRTLTPWVILRHDYMPHDFTMYMYRELRRR